eukprot:2627503-Amphidinium_carterae.1
MACRARGDSSGLLTQSGGVLDVDTCVCGCGCRNREYPSAFWTEPASIMMQLGQEVSWWEVLPPQPCGNVTHQLDKLTRGIGAKLHWVAWANSYHPKFITQQIPEPMQRT